MRSKKWPKRVAKNGQSDRPDVADHSESDCSKRANRLPETRKQNARNEQSNIDSTYKTNITERERAAFDCARSAFSKKFSQPPSWGVKDRTQLKHLFKRREDLTLEEFKRRWDTYIKSNDRWIKHTEGYGLGYFCSKFDSFLSDPAGPGMRKIRAPRY